jgi:C-terminal processing protease CtpA/Prc
LHYNGNVYVVQGGYTFSAAAMFVLSIKEQQNVTVVGEETGGGDYGTTAIHLPTIILPNSKLRITLPLYRIVPDNHKTKTGRGIQPDVFIPPSSVAIKNGVDPKLQKIKELIHTNAKKRF